jgi:hypothetical protein
MQLQVQLLQQLRADRRVWSATELGEIVTEALGEPSTGAAPAATVRAALQALTDAGLAHRVSYELVSVSRRGLLADPGGAAVAPSEATGGVGVFDDEGASEGRELHGGAEGLQAGLVPVVPRRAGE